MGPARALIGLGPRARGGVWRATIMTMPRRQPRNMAVYRAMASATAPYLTSTKPSPLLFARNNHLATSMGRGPASQRRTFASAPTPTAVVMPALSPTMTTGTISAWLKNPGDKCSAGDVLAEIETDKATVSFEVQDDFVLAKILEPAKGREIKVGELVAVSVEDEEAYQAYAALDKAGKAPLPEGAGAAPSAPAKEAAAPTAATPPPPSSGGAAADLGPFSLMPAARHLLESRGLALAAGVVGTGKDGRITKGDAIAAIAAGKTVAKPRTAAAPVTATATAPAPAAKAAAPRPAPVGGKVSITLPEIHAPAGTFTDSANTTMRRIIAKRLTESKTTTPHAYSTVECELDSVLKLRKKLKNEYEVSVSVNDVVIRSVALALRDVPEANATWDLKKNERKSNPNVDISIAVATPAGLITPIIPQTDKKGLTDISKKMKDLAGRARAGKLKPEEFQGGSFTISNLGMFGIDEFSAVINPPQGCIMAVGRGASKLKVAPYKEGEKPPKPYVANVMRACISYDRRVMDEATASQFMQAFKNYISTPTNLLL